MATLPRWKRPKDPMKTRSGKARLGPLNLAQLEDLLEKSQRPREKQRVRNRIVQLEKRKVV